MRAAAAAQNGCSPPADAPISGTPPPFSYAKCRRKRFLRTACGQIPGAKPCVGLPPHNFAPDYLSFDVTLFSRERNFCFRKGDNSISTFYQMCARMSTPFAQLVAQNRHFSRGCAQFFGAFPKIFRGSSAAPAAIRHARRIVSTHAAPVRPGADSEAQGFGARCRSNAVSFSMPSSRHSCRILQGAKPPERAREDGRRRGVGIPPYRVCAREDGRRRDVGIPPYGVCVREDGRRRDVGIPPYRDGRLTDL